MKIRDLLLREMFATDGYEEITMLNMSSTMLCEMKKSAISLCYRPLLIALSLVIFSMPAQAGGFTYEPIDPLANGLVQAFGVDQPGNVTGNVDPGDGERIGFILDTNSGELTLVPEVVTLFDLNNDGEGSAIVTGDDGESVCALRDRDGVITTFDPPSIEDGFLTDCSARGRNASGVVSGWERGVNGWVGFIHDPQMGTFEEFLPTAASGILLKIRYTRVPLQAGMASGATKTGPSSSLQSTEIFGPGRAASRITA
jgi:hypothetical protein